MLLKGRVLNRFEEEGAVEERFDSIFYLGLNIVLWDI